MAKKLNLTKWRAWAAFYRWYAGTFFILVPLAYLLNVFVGLVNTIRMRDHYGSDLIHEIECELQTAHARRLWLRQQFGKTKNTSEADEVRS